MHWPEQFLNRSGRVKATMFAVAHIGLMVWARLRGAKMVWTVHNLQAHERRHPGLEQWYRAAFLFLLDGFVSLTEAGHQEAMNRFPMLSGKASAVIPRGHYRGVYPETVSRAQARERLGISAEALVVLHLGQIRSYKNVPGLIRCFRDTASSDDILLIAGLPFNEKLRSDVVNASGGDPRVRLHLDFIPDEHLQVFLRAADMAVFPYSDVLNSGGVLLALSFDLPTIAPAMGAIPEVQEWVGPDWVHTYHGAFSGEVLARALEWRLKTKRSGRPNLERLDWVVVARETVNFFETLTGPAAHGPGNSARSDDNDRDDAGENLGEVT